MRIIGRDYVGGLLVARGWFRKDVGGTVHAVGCWGQSFRLACPAGQGDRGSEDPRLLRDRPADGAALAAKMHADYRA